MTLKCYGIRNFSENGKKIIYIQYNRKKYMVRILIAGAGHGGIIAGTILAKNKYDVIIFEKQREEDLGYPWYDDVFKRIFDELGISLDSIQFHPKDNIRFYSPNLQHTIELNLPESKREIAIHRKDLYKLLLKEAKEAGVTFHFEEEVVEPIVENSQIKGIKTTKGVYYGDLIIDALGLNSVLKSLLSKSFNLPHELKKGRVFYTYRAYFNFVGEIPTAKNFNVYFKFNGINGIAWYRFEDGDADVLLGSIEPLTDKQIVYYIAKMRTIQPTLGTELKHGGFLVKIPISHTPYQIVLDNYACVGDSAFMTMPMMGSGIELAMLAGKKLAEAIIEFDNDENLKPEREKGYPIKFLWEHYQVPYFLQHGSQMASVDYLKNFMLAAKLKELDFLFEKQIITAKDMEKTIADGGEVDMEFFDLLSRIIRGFSRIDLLLSLKINIDTMKEVKAIAKKIPKNYDPIVIEKWGKKYEKILAEMEDQIK